MSINTAKLPKACYEKRSFRMRRPLVRPSRDNFAENLKRMMAAKNLRNADIAREFKISRATVGRWVDGASQPDYEAIDRLAKLLGVPVSTLFEDPTDPASTGIQLDKALRMVNEAVKDLDLDKAVRLVTAAVKEKLK